jgi:hypothetical protein
MEHTHIHRRVRSQTCDCSRAVRSTSRSESTVPGSHRPSHVGSIPDTSTRSRGVYRRFGPAIEYYGRITRTRTLIQPRARAACKAMIDSSRETPLMASRLRLAPNLPRRPPSVKLTRYQKYFPVYPRTISSTCGASGAPLMVPGSPPYRQPRACPQARSSSSRTDSAFRVWPGRGRYDSRPIERRNKNRRVPDPLPDRFDRGVIQPSRIEAQFPREALGLH